MKQWDYVNGPRIKLIAFVLRRRTGTKVERLSNPGVQCSHGEPKKKEIPNVTRKARSLSGYTKSAKDAMLGNMKRNA